MVERVDAADEAALMAEAEATEEVEMGWEVEVRVVVVAEQVPQAVAPGESHSWSEWLSVDKQLPPLDWVATLVYWLWSRV